MVARLGMKFAELRSNFWFGTYRLSWLGVSDRKIKAFPGFGHYARKLL